VQLDGSLGVHRREIDAVDGLGAMGRLASFSLKVLVVDDDGITRELLREALELRGADVRVSANAPDAHHVVESWRPDVVISDLGMPDEDGYGLVRRIREFPPDAGGATPAIACSSYCSARDRHRALEAGFDALVPKPVDLDLLLDTIGHLSAVRGVSDTAAVLAATSDVPSPDSAGGLARSAPDS
jgi:CheY-like chemotaxis protein